MVYQEFLSDNNISQADFQFLLPITSTKRINNPFFWSKNFNNFRTLTSIFPFNDFLISSSGLKASNIFPYFLIIWNREHEFMMFLYVSHAWPNLSISCISIFSTVSSGNLSQSLIFIAILDWLFVQRLVVVNNIVDRIFDTIITTLINFALWEVLMFVDTIQISKKSFNCAFLYFFQFLIIPVLQCDQTYCGDVWPNHLKVSFLSIFKFIVS